MLYHDACLSGRVECSATFAEIFRSEGIKVIHTHRSRHKAYVERFVHTIQAECLDWLLIVGRRQLERGLHTYEAFYNRQPLTVRWRTRTNQQQRSNTGTIERRDLLGGLVREYYQAPAPSPSVNRTSLKPASS